MMMNKNKSDYLFFFRKIPSAQLDEMLNTRVQDFLPSFISTERCLDDFQLVELGNYREMVKIFLLNFH